MGKGFITIIFTFVFFLTACSQGVDKKTSEYKSPNGNTMVLTLFQNPKTLDIQKTNADYFIPLQIYDRLVDVKVNDKGKPEIIPSLAEKWEISDDGLTYTFHLRKGVHFHNGEELKSDDVLFTIEKMMDPKEAAINSYQFDKIEGALDKLNGKADKVSGVKVIDDYTIQLKLDSPYSPFLASLTGAPASIYNRKAVEEGKDKFGFDPKYTVGTGYMKFKDWSQDKEINLVKNENYFKKSPSIDGVKYLMNIDKSTERMMFDNGELDFMRLDYSNISNYKENSTFKDCIIDFNPPSMDYLIYNQKDPNMAKKEVRQAISMAIDRELFNKNFYDGEGILLNGVVPPGMPGYNENLPKIEYNPEKSKKIISDLGLTNKINLVILQNGSQDYTHPMNEMIQTTLKNVGINAEIKNMDMTSYWDTVAKGDGFAITLGPITADVPDPDDFYKSFTIEASKSEGYNVTNKQLSDKINAARSIRDDKKRLEALGILDKEIVHEEAMYLPIAAQKRHFIKSPRLENFHLSWQGWVCGSTLDVTINKSYNK